MLLLRSRKWWMFFQYQFANEETSHDPTDGAEHPDPGELFAGIRHMLEGNTVAPVQW